MRRKSGVADEIVDYADRPVLIFGGAGFIGTNLAEKFILSGIPVKIFDNLSRSGVEENLRWLKETYGTMVQAEVGDIRDPLVVKRVVKGCRAVFNFAAQVAVTTSLADPVTDFEINLRGTLNILEAVRNLNEQIPILFTSTNKVYGSIEDLQLVEKKSRYEPYGKNMLTKGINENRPLDFHSPYGCSKGGADQYILDYCRSYNIPTVVFRMSCIYGPHQFGNEDQGWIAHFLIQALKKKTITLYGSGKQVRDALFVRDLADAFWLALQNINDVKGNAFNIGGGVNNTISLIELLEHIEKITGEKLNVTFDEWRTGDQKYYVSDTGKFSKTTGWKQKTSVKSGIQQLYDWLLEYHPAVGRKSVNKIFPLAGAGKSGEIAV